KPWTFLQYTYPGEHAPIADGLSLPGFIPSGSHGGRGLGDVFAGSLSNLHQRLIAGNPQPGQPSEGAGDLPGGGDLPVGRGVSFNFNNVGQDQVTPIALTSDGLTATVSVDRADGVGGMSTASPANLQLV